MFSKFYSQIYFQRLYVIYFGIIKFTANNKNTSLPSWRYRPMRPWAADFTGFRLLLGVFENLRNVTIKLRHVRLSVCLSVCPHATTRFPLDGFVLNFIFKLI